MEIKARDLIRLMEQWAPPMLAEKWDNPGMQAGSAEQPVHKVLVSLDLTKQNAQFAAENHINMIISHHPFLFRGLKTVDLQTEKGQILQTLLTHGITAFAAHTNLDTAEDGVNDALAAALEMKNLRGFVPIRKRRMYKLVTYVPELQEERILAALKDAGAGQIGHYSGCAFSSAGLGRFCPDGEAQPFCGERGKENTEREVRIETCVSEEQIKNVTAALVKVHPYEEPVWDLYELANQGKWQTMGRIGEFPREMTGEEALLYVKERLGLPVVKYAGPVDGAIRRAAVLGGAGAEFAARAKALGADLYITGDVKYHEAQEAAAMGLLVIDGGHFYTERVIIPSLAERLRKTAADRGWDVEIIEDPTACDIFSYK